MAKVEDKMVRVWLKDFERLREIKEQMIVDQRKAVSDAEVFEHIMNIYQGKTKPEDDNDILTGFNLENFK